MKRGDVFLHRHVLGEDGQPARCTVTSVTNGMVYWTYAGSYDKGDRRGAFKFPQDREWAHVLPLCDHCGQPLKCGMPDGREFVLEHGSGAERCDLPPGEDGTYSRAQYRGSNGLPYR